MVPAPLLRHAFRYPYINVVTTGYRRWSVVGRRLPHLPPERVHAPGDQARIPIARAQSRAQKREGLAPCGGGLLQVGVAVRVARADAEGRKEAAPSHLLDVVVLQAALCGGAAPGGTHCGLFGQAGRAPLQLILP